MKDFRLFLLSLACLTLMFLFVYCGNNSSSGNNPDNSFADNYPAAGNPEGHYTVPADAGEGDVSSPDNTVGDGTPESCTAQAFIDAVANGGKIVFNCGSEPKTIVLSEPAKIFNDKGPDIIIDGGSKIILSGNDVTRILYMNTCDPNQVWTTAHCDDQDHPRLIIQNLTFINGNSSSDTEYDGGGAVWVRGGRFKVVNCRFFNNICAAEGPDVGGGAIRVSDQYNDLPVYIVHSTFGGGTEYGNSGSNGGAISSLGVSWSIYNSLFSYNTTTGEGGSPAAPDTPGGGCGGAIYNDGLTMTLAIYGTKIENNIVNTYGAAILFMSNNHSGNIIIKDSVIRSSPSV